MDIIKQIECCGKRLDNGELVHGAYVPDYTLDNPSEAGWIVDREYGINYPVDPKTVELVKESEKDEEITKLRELVNSFNNSMVGGDFDFQAWKATRA